MQLRSCSSEGPGEREGFGLLTDGGADIVAMLHHIDLSRNVEQAIKLIAVLAQVRWLHRMKPRRSFEQERARVPAAVDHQIRRQDIAFFATPVARH